jgi:hypothetical protein
MPGYDHLFGGSSSSNTGTSGGAVGGYTPPSGNSGSSGSSSQNNNQTGTSGGAVGGYTPPPPSVGQTNEDGLTQAEVNKIKAQNQAANEAAYQASLAKQEEMKKAIGLAYNTVAGQQQSNFQNLSNSQKQFLIDSGFAAAESSGVLGGTFGAELVSNQLKQDLANATNQQEFNEAIAALDKLAGSQGVTNQMYQMGLLNPDKSAVYSFGDVESNPYLYQAYQNMASKNLTPSQYTDYMDNISAFGHMGTKLGGTGSGGFGGYGGYGGGGGGGGGYSYGIGGGLPQTYQRGQVGPGNLQEQVNQAFLSGGKPFAKGGIVSLVED